MEKRRHSDRYQRVLTELRRARLEAGLTQAEVAASFDSHASFVSKCESGERRIDVVELVEFCHLYGVTVRTLLRRAELE